MKLNYIQLDGALFPVIGELSQYDVDVIPLYKVTEYSYRKVTVEQWVSIRLSTESIKRLKEEEKGLPIRYVDTVYKPYTMLVKSMFNKSNNISKDDRVNNLVKQLEALKMQAAIKEIREVGFAALRTIINNILIDTMKSYEEKLIDRMLTKDLMQTSDKLHYLKQGVDCKIEQLKESMEVYYREVCKEVDRYYRKYPLLGNPEFIKKLKLSAKRKVIEVTL